MGLQKFHWSLLLIIIGIMIGVSMSSFGGIKLNLFGSIIVISSTIAMSLRWCLTQVYIEYYNSIYYKVNINYHLLLH